MLLMLIFPLFSIWIDFKFYHQDIELILLIGKWFIFWSIGCRLFTAGLRQILKPSFTAETIFHLKETDSYVVVRELGTANICMGVAAIISLFIPQWRVVVAFSGGLFLGIAGIMHVLRRPDNPNQIIPMISNLLVFFIMLVYLVNEYLIS